MKFKSNTFACFSPLVMVSTFAIEIGLFFYLIIRYKMSPLTRLIAAALVLLGTFQFAEYQICTNGTAGEIFSRVGFAAITLLPPLGLHIIYLISNRGISKNWVRAGYLTAIAFILVFLLGKNTFDSYACGGNYAVFSMTEGLGGAFFVYYYFWLFFGIYKCYKLSQSASLRVRKALTYQAFGYLSFVLPAGIVNMINPSTISGIPSIMCGFAIIYAFILAFGVAPLTLEKKAKK